jgi:predicted HicB family RNase H-like nuclease
MEKSKRLNIEIPEKLHKEFRLLALHQDTTMKDIMIKCIKRKLKSLKNLKNRAAPKGVPAPPGA